MTPTSFVPGLDLRSSVARFPCPLDQGLRAACESAGIDDEMARSLLTRSSDEEVKERLEEHTALAIERYGKDPTPTLGLRATFVEATPAYLHAL